MEEIGIIDAIKDETLPRGESAKGADVSATTYEELDTDDLYVRWDPWNWHLFVCRLFELVIHVSAIFLFRC